jgi:hypothetical protein
MTRPRALAALSVVLLVIASVVGSLTAGAQTEGEVTEAEERKLEANHLVSEAVAERDRIEAELLVALEQYQQINFEVAELSSGIDDLGLRIGDMGVRLQTARSTLGDRAVTAYIRAVTSPATAVLGVSDLEDLMIARRAVEVISAEDHSRIAEIAVARADLAKLQSLYQADLTALSEIQFRAEAHADRLVELFMSADQALGTAIDDARSADASYKAALDALELAQVKEAARKREEARRQATTTLVPVTTALVGPRTFRPAVEQWRSLVSTYFADPMVDAALSVIACESVGDPNAYNPYSGASGLFQFLPGTWAVASSKAGFAGVSPFDAEANTASAAWLTRYYESRGKDPWTAWSCKPRAG